jgi:hypothetical protein
MSCRPSPQFQCSFKLSFQRLVISRAHHAYWFSPWDPSDPRGDLLAAAIKNSNHCILNLDSQTRQPFNNPPHSSDVTIASAHLLPSLTWSTHTQLNSDHLPITISFRTIDRARRTFPRIFRKVLLKQLGIIFHQAIGIIFPLDYPDLPRQSLQNGTTSNL